MQIHGDGLPESYVIALTEAADIVAHKNRGYGRDEDPWHNFRAGEAIGINPQGMVMLRILEKINRLTNHYRGAQGVDPREEALDAANLSLILVALIDEAATDATPDADGTTADGADS